MGTNYYADVSTCKCCNRTDTYHLGKSSAGWTFTFQAIDNDGVVVRNYDQWLELIKRADRVYDEYGDDQTAEQMVALVEGKRKAPNNHTIYMNTEYRKINSWYRPDGTQYWLDQYGNSFSLGDFT